MASRSPNASICANSATSASQAAALTQRITALMQRMKPMGRSGDPPLLPLFIAIRSQAIDL
jgi:hypothetical protein